MDLGRKIPDGPSLASDPAPDKPRVSYPGFSLNDEVAKAFAKEAKPALGQEYSATITFKVTSLRQDEYGASVGLDVLTLDDVKPDSEDESEDNSEEKILGIKRPKITKESPDISASSFAD